MQSLGMSTLHRQSWTSSQVRERLQLPDRRDEALSLQRCEILLDTILGFQKSRPHFAQCAADDAGNKAELIAQKFIRVLSFVPEWCQRGVRKILEVLPYDDMETAHDSRSEHMPVVPFRKRRGA